MNVAPVAATLAGIYGLASGVVTERPLAAPAAPAAIRQPAPLRAFTVADSLAAIRWAAARWGVSYPWLLRVAECESGLRSDAYNPSGASGLMQWMPSSYWGLAERIGETRSYWDPYAAANVASYAFSRGLSSMWSCR